MEINREEKMRIMLDGVKPNLYFISCALLIKHRCLKGITLR